MAYTPNTWAAGDTITAQKLNNMEQGIAAAGTIILATSIDEQWQYADVDMTAAEIVAAVKAGKKVYLYCWYEEENIAYYMSFVGEYKTDGALAYAMFSTGGAPLYVDTSGHVIEELG